MTKLGSLDIEIILNYLGWPDVITRVLVRGLWRVGEGDVTRESEVKESERDRKVLYSWL